MILAECLLALSQSQEKQVAHLSSPESSQEQPFVKKLLLIGLLTFQLKPLGNEPAHEIMVLFVLRKLILKVRMRSHPLRLDVWDLSDPLSTSILHVC